MEGEEDCLQFDNGIFQMHQVFANRLIDLLPEEHYNGKEDIKFVLKVGVDQTGGDPRLFCYL